MLTNPARIRKSWMRGKLDKVLLTFVPGFLALSRVASRFIRTNQQGPFALTNRIGVPLRLRVLLGAASSSDHIMDSSRSSEKEDAYRGTGTGTK